MKNYRIGDLIRSRRAGLGISQQKLCEGICSLPTLSRIETGKQNPTKRHLDALLQRLGLSSEQYYAFISSQEFEGQELETEIKKCVVTGEPEKALALLERLEALSGDDPLLQQFILRERSIIGFYQNGEVVPYPDEEILRMCWQAIQKTIPAFSLKNLPQYLLSIEEIKTIVNLASYYSERNQEEEALDIYAGLWEYIHRHCMSMEEISYVLPLIAYDYSRELGLAGRYEESLAVSEEGRTCSVKYGKTILLGELLTNQGYVLHKLNRIDECIRTMKAAYYVFLAMEKWTECGVLKEYLEDQLHYTVDDASDSVGASCGEVGAFSSPDRL